MRLYMEQRIDIKRAETIAVCIAAQKCTQTRSNVVIHTDNKLIAHNCDRRVVQNNIEAEICMRVRWQHGFATRIVWHASTEVRQRDAHNAAGEASAGIGTRIVVGNIKTKETERGKRLE